MNPLIQFRTTTLPFLIAFALACFGLSPTGRAVVPAPDGGYPGFNTAEGENALFSLTIGGSNTAIGFDALYFNTTGTGNTATGDRALLSNISNDNTANGSLALLSNTIGSRNTATGSQALGFNIEGHDNTAMGYQALHNNVGGEVTPHHERGNFNTAVGSQALFSNNFGDANTATGYHALFSNGGVEPAPFGGDNTADGADALHSNTTGDANTAIGEAALFNTTGSSNIGLGASAGANLTTGDNNIDIGDQGVAAEANTIRIGTQGTQKATFIAGIIGNPIAGATVHISGTGQLGIGPPSSLRFKDEIKSMDKASEAILALKPVTFRYKKEIDPDRAPQFGLVAEDVEKISPDLVTRDEQGKLYTVRYEAVNAMLLNEFLKEHREVQEQKATISQLKSAVAQQQKDFQETAANQQKQIEALTAGLQKVSAQIEASKPATQMATNNQ